MPTNQHRPPQKRLRVLQQNLNKSHSSLSAFLVTAARLDIDIIVLQEPPFTASGNITLNHLWTRILPPGHNQNGHRARSAILVRSSIQTSSWEEMGSTCLDLTGIRLHTTIGKIDIYNLYDDQETSAAMTTMETIMDNGGVLGDADFIITLGDFNAHHSMWEVTGNEHLYRKPADRARGERVVRFTADYGLSMALPPGLATLRAHGSKNLTRPDNIFCSPELMDYLVSCDVSEPNQPPRTDHYPILLELDLSVPESAPCERWDWRGADMAKYDEALALRLAMHAPPRECTTRGQFDSLCLQLETALREAREETIKKLRPSPYQKRWWNSALDEMRERVQELGRRSHHFRSVRDHPVHCEFRQTQDAYGDAIEAAKSTHWEEWLESIDAQSIWIAHRYTGDIPLGSRSARIPTLSVYDAVGNEQQASDNESKGRAFYDCFFPQHPGQTELPELDDAARNWEPMRVITREQIQRVASNLSPYKAPGDDDIPNVVLKSCIDTLLEWLYWIFQACATRGFYRDEWRHFITVVLRKPGRATYKVAKSFRPVALYRTTPKLLHACICEDISYIVETENLLPNTHFGGRPRRTTTDSLHLLTQTVKDAWRRGDVATVLFLDTAGAFPNAVPERLCHNMRARRVPEGYVRFVETITGRNLDFCIHLKEAASYRCGKIQ